MAKKKLKMMVASALAGVTALTGIAFGFAGCGGDDDIVKDQNTNITDPNTPVKPVDPITPIDPVTPVDPDKDKEEQAKKELAAAMVKYNAIVDKIEKSDNNLTITNVSNGNTTQFLFDGNKAKSIVNNSTTYASVEDCVVYEIVYKDNAWHKAKSTDITADDLDATKAAAELKAYSFTTYDKTTNTLTGANCTAKVTDDTLIIVDKYSNSTTYSNIYTTNVTLPENVIDDTKPVEKDALYDTQGKLIFENLGNALTEWFCQDGYYQTNFKPNSDKKWTAYGIESVVVKDGKIHFNILSSGVGEDLSVVNSCTPLYLNPDLGTKLLETQDVKTKTQLFDAMSKIGRGLFYMGSYPLRSEFTSSTEFMTSKDEKCRMFAIGYRLLEELDGYEDAKIVNVREWRNQAGFGDGGVFRYESDFIISLISADGKSKQIMPTVSIEYYTGDQAIIDGNKEKYYILNPDSYKQTDDFVYLRYDASTTPTKQEAYTAVATKEIDK